MSDKVLERESGARSLERAVRLTNAVFSRTVLD